MDQSLTLASSSIKTPAKPTITKPKPSRTPKIGKSATGTPHYKTNLLHDTQSRRNEARAALNLDQKRITVEELFDEFMENALVAPLHEALEPRLKKMFNSEKAILWIDKPEIRAVFSSTYQITAEYNNSLPGLIFKSKSVIQIRDVNQAPGGYLSDPRIASPNAPVLFFPLTANSVTRGVVQIVKRTSAGGFNDVDMNTVSIIMKKFSIYGDHLFASANLSQIALTLFSAEEAHSGPLELLQKHFLSQTVELWHFDINKLTGQKYDPIRQEMAGSTIQESGIVGQSIKTRNPINLFDATESDFYIQSIDGVIQGPILSVPYFTSSREAWAIALRGRSKPFNANDQTQLQALLPFVVRSISGFSKDSNPSFIMSQLSDLLSAAVAITSCLDIQQLIKAVQDQISILLRCVKCTFYFIDTAGQIVRDYGSPSAQSFSRDVEIVGHVSTTPSIINLDEAKSSEFYFSDTDGLLSPLIVAPVFEGYCTVRGVVLVSGKQGNGGFDEDDEKTLTAVTVFAGIALHNAILHSSLILITDLMRDFLLKLKHTNSPEDIQPKLSAIFDLALKPLQATRITLYDDKEIFVTSGNETKITVPKKATETTIEEEEADGTEMSFSTHRISSVFNQSTGQITPDFAKLIKHVKIPLFDDSEEFIGTLECRLFISDMSMLDSLAEICRAALRRTMQPFRPKDWMDETELSRHEIPKKMATNIEFTRMEYDIREADPIDLFKFIFKIFSQLDLMDTFDISCVRLFHFLNELKRTYQEVPVHNWRRAVGCVAGVYRYLVIYKLQRYLEKEEILALVVSSLAFCLGNDDYASLSNPRCAVPYQVMFEKEHLLETQALESLYQILARGDFDILHNASQRVPAMINELIFATTYTRFSEALDLTQLVCDDQLDLKNLPGHRMLLMKVALRCALIAPMIAQKSIDVVAEDFFMQNVHGKGRSKQAFFEMYAIPMFKALSYVLTLSKQEYQSVIDLSKE